MTAEIIPEGKQLQVWVSRTDYNLQAVPSDKEVSDFSQDLRSKHCNGCKARCTGVRPFPGISSRWLKPVAIAQTKYHPGEEERLREVCGILTSSQ